MARKKISSTASSQIKADIDAPIIPTGAADNLLEESKGKYASVLVLGVKEDGGTESVTNIESFPFAQYLLNRTSFELFIVQRSKEQNT